MNEEATPFNTKKPTNFGLRVYGGEFPFPGSLFCSSGDKTNTLEKFVFFVYAKVLNPFCVGERPRMGHLSLYERKISLDKRH